MEGPRPRGPGKGTEARAPPEWEIATKSTKRHKTNPLDGCTMAESLLAAERPFLSTVFPFMVLPALPIRVHLCPSVGKTLPRWESPRETPKGTKEQTPPHMEGPRAGKGRRGRRPSIFALSAFHAVGVTGFCGDHHAWWSVTSGHAERTRGGVAFHLSHPRSSGVFSFQRCGHSVTVRP